MLLKSLTAQNISKETLEIVSNTSNVSYYPI